MRLIDADAIYKILESCEIRKATIGNPLTDWEYGYTCGIERAESEIECAPTVDAVPVRHGKWLCSDDMYETAVCSVCNYDTEEPYEYVKKSWNFCPNCGAKMERKEE